VLKLIVFSSVLIALGFQAGGSHPDSTAESAQKSDAAADAAASPPSPGKIMYPPKFPPPSDAERQEFEYLIAGMKGAREKISRAMVSYTGRRTRKDAEELSASVDGRIQGMMAFDMKNRRLRIEHTMPEAYGPDITENQLKSSSAFGKPVESFGGPFAQIDQFLMFVENESYSAHYAKNGKHDSNLDISMPGWSLASERDLLHLIDLRSLGMIDVQDYSGWKPPVLYDGATLTLDDSSLLCPLETVLHNFNVRKHFQLIKKDGLVTIEWRTHRLTIDERKGFAPVEYRTTEDYWKIYHRSYTSTTSWGNVSGHWVPISAVLEMDDERRAKHERFELNLEWSKINEELSNNLFQFESFKNVDDETYVVDSRPGAGGILGEWIGGKLQTRFETQPPPPRSSRFIIIGSLSLFIMLTLFLVRARSRFRSRTNDGSGSAE
jgi:hypothetical protein